MGMFDFLDGSNPDNAPGLSAMAAFLSGGGVGGGLSALLKAKQEQQQQGDYSKLIASFGGNAPNTGTIPLLNSHMPPMGGGAPAPGGMGGPDIMGILRAAPPDILRQILPDLLKQRLAGPKPLTANEALLAKQKDDEVRRAQTEADYKTLDQGSADIAKAMTPQDVGTLGIAAPGLSWQQRMAVNTQQQQKDYQNSPEYKAQVAGAEAQARVPAEISAAKGKSEATNVPFDPDTIDFMAEQALAGDRSVFTQLGYGAAGQANRAALRNKIMEKGKERGVGGRDLAALNAEFSGLQAGERTLGTRTANIEMAANEVEQLAPLALQASNAVDRTRFPALNSILLAGERQTGDPAVVKLGVATNSLINAYARGISPNGTPTVSDKDHAREILSNAWAKGQYAAAVDQMQKEIAAARRSPGVVRGDFRSAISGGGAPGSAPVPDAAGRPNAPSVPGASESKTINGVTYHKVNGQWMQ